MVRFHRANHVVTRATSAILLLVGAGLLVAWLDSPARSSPSPQSNVPVSPLEAAAPVFNDVHTNVRALRERLDAPRPASTPSRDPFRYATRTPRPIAAPVTSPEAAAREVALVAPRLIAILAGDGDDRRAVFETIDGDVRFARTGETVDAFVVREVSADAVVLGRTRDDAPLRIALH